MQFRHLALQSAFFVNNLYLVVVYAGTMSHLPDAREKTHLLLFLNILVRAA
jgi:hypothetical protein